MQRIQAGAFTPLPRRLLFISSFLNAYTTAKAVVRIPYMDALRWIDENSPADLEWPDAMSRKLVKAMTAKRRVA